MPPVRSYVLCGLLITLMGVGGTPSAASSGGSAPASRGVGSAPTVLEIALPAEIPQEEAARGTVRYRDPDGDVSEARFHVVDGKYDPFTVKLTAEEGRREEGGFAFRVVCALAQQVTLKLVLIDAAGHRSAPTGFSFTCGRPPLGNYDEEQAAARPIARTLGMNLFVLDDGVTTLSEGAVFSAQSAAVGAPRGEVRRAIEHQVVPAVTGIWDQCGIAFRLNALAVIRPERIVLAEGTLDELLFLRDEGLTEIALADPDRQQPIDLLAQALAPLAEEVLEVHARPLEIEKALTVFVTGARLVARPGDRAHFGGATTLGGRISLIRWDAILVTDSETGSIVPPKRPITAIAHEFGHNFGLEHVSPEEAPLNLMLSVPGRPTAVPPQPTVDVLPSQCERVQPVIQQLALSDE